MINALHQIAIGADDLDAATAFYRDVLGLTFIARFDPPGLVFFDLGGVRLLIERGAPSGVCYFHVDDIAEACRTLTERGVTFTQAPHVIHTDDAGQFGPAGASEWMAFFEDPAGNTLALASQVPVP